VCFRYDPDRARFEDPPCVNKPDDETAFKFCPSCVRIRQKEQVWFDMGFSSDGFVFFISAVHLGRRVPRRYSGSCSWARFLF